MAYRKAAVLDRFEEKVVRIPEAGCWIWVGFCNKHGYGRFSFQCRSMGAHRFSYEQYVGKVPEGLELDHLCRTRSCVNPSHLEPVTSAENTRRGIGSQVTRLRHAEKTHCPQGHPYESDNTYLYAGHRACKTCNRHRALQRYYKQRSTEAAA